MLALCSPDFVLERDVIRQRHPRAIQAACRRATSASAVRTIPPALLIFRAAGPGCVVAETSDTMALLRTTGILTVAVTGILGVKPVMSDLLWPALEPEVELNRSWAEAAFSPTGRAFEPPGRLTVVHEDHPGDTKPGRCAFGGPILLGDRTYERGIGVNSHSVMRVTLAQPAERFLADIGLDRNVDGTVASVRFHVSVAGEDLFATDVMRPADGVRSIDVPLDGAREIDFVVDVGPDDRAFDQADWADARIVLEDGSDVWLDDLAGQSAIGDGFPFSFVYGGTHSSALLAGWTAELSGERPGDGRLDRTLTLTDPATGLALRVDRAVYTDSPGVDWTIHFTNTGDEDTPVLEQVRALDVAIAPGLGSAPVLHRLKGSSFRVDDWMPLADPVEPGQRIEFAPAEGKSSLGACPFFHVDWGGGGAITAVGWSGQWVAAVEHEQGGRLRIEAGQQTLRTRLRPGETLRGPRIMQLHWRGGDGVRACNLFRQTMLKHIVPKIDGETIPPPIAHLSTSFYELNDSTEENVLSHLKAIEGLGFEFFWLDAYWTRDGFPQGMGNYGFPIERAEPPDRFPRGIRPISDVAREAGMGFLLWFEPERVAAGTHIARENPEWVISPGGDGGGLLNLGIPEAREYMTRYLNAVIEAYGIDCLRIDFNINPLPYWTHADGGNADRAGVTEARYVQGHYRMWDDLLAAHPRLFIDNCASGGMRIDLETCSRSIPLWRTDATIPPLMPPDQDFEQAALQNQLITGALSRYVPFSVSGNMGATPYLFRSGCNAGISFCEDCRPDDYPRALLAKGIAEAKRLRKYAFGNLYPLSELTLSTKDWCVLQYHRPDEGDGMVIAFRRHESPYSGYECDLREIDPTATYRVTEAHTYERSKARPLKGVALQGLRLDISGRPGSVVVEYTPVE